MITQKGNLVGPSEGQPDFWGPLHVFAPSPADFGSKTLLSLNHAPLFGGPGCASTKDDINSANPVEGLVPDKFNRSGGSAMSGFAARMHKYSDIDATRVGREQASRVQAVGCDHGCTCRRCSLT